MDLVRAASSLFPEVLHAVEQLRETNPNRETRTFARRVASEKIIYDQFAQRLKLLSPLPSASQGLMVDVEDKIGPAAAKELQSDLGLMNEGLRVLKADLFNASRGTEVLAKLGRKTSPLKAPAASSPLQKSLAGVSQTNKRLSAYLLQPLVSLPTERDLKVPLELRILAEAPVTTVSRLLQVTGDRFSCFSCTDTILGISTPSTEEVRHTQCEGNTPFKQQYFGSLKVSVDNPVTKSNHSFNHCTRPAASPQAPQTYFNPRNNSENHTGHHIVVSVRSKEVQPDLLELTALVEKIGRSLELSERVDLSFHVALITLLVLFEVPPFQSIEKDHFTILSERSHLKGPYNLLLQSPSNPPATNSGHKSSSQDMLSIMTEDLALARLGVHLVQIMFGRTMERMRSEDPNLLVTSQDFETEIQDIITARQLLTSRRVRNKLGRDFEAIINVCLNQQYRERKLARVVKLDRQGSSFAKHATSLILMPLFQELRRTVGCFCDPFSDNDHQLHEIPTQIQPKSVEHPDVDGTGDVEHSSWHLFENGPGDLSDQDLAKDQTPTMSNREISTSVSGHSVAKGVSIAVPSHTRGSSQEHVVAASGLHGPSPTGPQNDINKKRTESGVFAKSPQSPESRESLAAMASPSLHLSPGLVPSRIHDTDARRAPESVLSTTTSGTTESWLDWLSDRTEEPPALAQDHPLSFLTPAAIAILLSSYNNWRTCGMEQDPGSAAGPDGLSPTTNRRKRPKFSHDGRDEDDGNGDDDADKPSDPTSRKKQPLSESGVTFSCPFLKKDSVKHGECSKYMLSRIRDVKQHLGRRHQMPIYCPRCIETFPDEDSRDEHNRNVDCERSQLGKPEGITEAQKKALGKKAPANHTQEQQWYGIFDILFPGHPRPESPYIDSALLRNAFIYQSFLHSNGPRILSSILESSGAMTWNPPPFPHTDVQVWREQVLAQAFQQLFDRWAATGAVRSTNPSHDISNGFAVPPAGTSSTHMMLNPQQTIETEGSSTMGDDMYRFDVPSSETASSVSEMLSWQSESDFLNSNTNIRMMPGPFGAMPVTQYNGNITFTAYETQELQRTFQRGMDFYNNGNGGDHNDNVHGYDRGTDHKEEQHHMHYGP